MAVKLIKRTYSLKLFIFLSVIVTDRLNTRKIPILRSAKHTQNSYSYIFLGGSGNKLLYPCDRNKSVCYIVLKIIHQPYFTILIFSEGRFECPYFISYSAVSSKVLHDILLLNGINY